MIRFNPRDASEAKDYDIPLMDANGNTLWKSHPDEEVDLAGLGMDADFLESEKIRYEYFNLDDQVMGLTEMKSRGVSEGDFIYTLGFPMGIVDVDRLYVIARMGCIARLRDTLEGHRKDFLIDAFIFPRQQRWTGVVQTRDHKHRRHGLGWQSRVHRHRRRVPHVSRHRHQPSDRGRAHHF